MAGVCPEFPLPRPPAQEGSMPLEDLLAFYGYEPVLPAAVEPSAHSSPSGLADELPDMTLDKVSTSPRRQSRSIATDSSP